MPAWPVPAYRLGGLSFHFDLRLVLYTCQVQVGQVLQFLQVAELFG